MYHREMVPVRSRAAESTEFQRLRLRLRLWKIDSDSNCDSDPHFSLFFHMSKSNVLKQWCLISVISSLHGLWCKILLANYTTKFSKSLPAPHIVNWSTTPQWTKMASVTEIYPKWVKCVLKTTDRVPPLPVNSFYGTKYYCAPMIFSACYPAKIQSEKAK